MLQFLFYYSQGLKQKTIATNCRISLRTFQRFCEKWVKESRQNTMMQIIEWVVLQQLFKCMKRNWISTARVMCHGPCETVWALLIVYTSTSPATGFAEIVPDSSKQTLMRVINRIFDLFQHFIPIICLCLKTLIDSVSNMLVGTQLLHRRPSKRFTLTCGNLQ
jgi:hypothetical protein